MPKQSTSKDSTNKGERLEDSSLDSISAEAVEATLAAEANLVFRPATKPTMGDVDGLAPKAADITKYKIPYKTYSTKSRKT